MSTAYEAFQVFEQEATAAIEAARNVADLEQVRILFLGKSKGRLKDLQSELGKATPAERPAIGQAFNDMKLRVTQLFDARVEVLSRPESQPRDFDVTLPGNLPRLGREHPITQTIEEFKEIIGRFGFTVDDGPELEDEYHNFDALNIPKDHPARDPLDNFYLAAAKTANGQPILLRSQTSTVQIRVMERTKPPVRIVSVGRVYRPDEIDRTHHQMFHQMEGLMVGEGVTMATLKSVLKMFAAAYLGEDVEIRFRPSFFPFTEPSVEVDVRWRDGWLELGGAGMVDPQVLENVGYDPETITGFAFGLGIARFCMLRHGIDDIRLFYENDLRFLKQF
ncbi:phenylalanyl-tRNA synthetase, alpha subunit [Planctopirus limnophila DSM 3776]|uniref:Phenylalanine--tRNA ligase alpha subunit n=1 Tax=Planctopirus limnophila (strain ATCC 43296 / DSM 3776 / IFAM 1008 / Mu 290) TaxID=521674 RepID=D5SPV6_PLAL2|nr:phenylalanine--tRNA ligase subunit alpha [Planctopirus limnophila]ADG68331.1 phenylalanyl-tRNA synthetase, alpha subunit [Planctopirus limnophila DSM 3776]